MAREVACEYCSDTFSTQGIRLHEKFCDERPDDVDDDRDDQDDVDDQQVLGADRDDDDRDDDSTALDRDDVDDQDDVDDADLTICPSCGNPDDDESPRIYAADADLKRFFQDQGEWSPGLDRLVDRADAWCANCHSFIQL